MNKVDKYIVKKRYAMAIRLLKDMIRKEDNIEETLDIYERLGNVYNIVENTDAAIDIFKKVIKEDSKRQWSYHGLGDAYRMKSIYSEAIINYEKSLKLNPACIDSILGIVNCRIGNGEYEAAINILQGRKNEDRRFERLLDKLLSLESDKRTITRKTSLMTRDFHSSERPHYCALSVVFNCNMQCKMCRIWRNKLRDELTVESWKKIITDLARLMDKNRTINFAGGEPLLKEGIIELIAHSRRMGFKPNICTNGWFIDKEMARRLIDAGTDIIALSLDSLNAKTHDYMRGVRGSYKRVMRAIRYLDKFNRNKDTKIHIQAVITKLNMEDLVALGRWAQRNDAINDITYLALIQPPNTNSDYQEWYKRDEFKMLWPQDNERIVSVIDEIAGLKTIKKAELSKIGNHKLQLDSFKEYFCDPATFYKKEVRCIVGKQAVNINTNGTVQLCPYLPSIGNMLEQDVEELWNSEAANSIRNNIKICNKKCHQILNCIQQFDR